jgi:Ser/Thr protein kinase RdoA (MazF antagonist)
VHPNQRQAASLPVELRRTAVPEEVRAWVAQHAGATVVRVRRLPGASSTAVHGLWLSDGRRLVLRRYVWPGFLVAEPEAPGRELDALRFARAHGLPVPEVVAADLTGTPMILMTFLAGRAIGSPDVRKLAETAASLHAVDAAGYGHAYFPWYEGTAHTPPAATTRPGLWERAIDVWLHGAPEYRGTFVHRDFHPGNVLWVREAVTGVVDWANACRGPWGCDIAHCRDNLIQWAGPAAADDFLCDYLAVTGETYDWYWEVASVMEHDEQHWTPQQVALAEPRLQSALDQL